MAQTKTTDDNSDHSDYGGDPAGGEADYYAVLGVAPSASHEAIHQAYRRLAKLWHPDRYTFAPQELQARAERRMRAISRAWAELGDPIRRRTYDQRRYGHQLHAAWPESYQHTVGQKRAENGAGMFAGMLCVILALPLLINLLNGSFREAWQAVIGMTLVLALATLAGFFFTGDSPLARAATNWAEGEPRGFHEQPVATSGSAASHAASHVVDETDDDDDPAGALAFDLLMEQALATIPNDFKPFMRNVLVRVEREPTEETLKQMEVGPHGTLFGLYSGVPLTAQGAQAAGTEIVTIYRGPIERYCHGDPERIRDQVRRTVLHEVAHHFGIDHDAMPDWIR